MPVESSSQEAAQGKQATPPEQIASPDAEWQAAELSALARVGGFCLTLIQFSSRPGFRILYWIVVKCFRNEELASTGARILRSRPWLLSSVVAAAIIVWLLASGHPTPPMPHAPKVDDSEFVFKDAIRDGGSPQSHADNNTSGTANAAIDSEAAPTVDVLARRRLLPSQDNCETSTTMETVGLDAVAAQPKRTAWLTGTIEDLATPPVADRTAVADKLLPDRQ